MTLWSFANFQETFLDQSIWICKWVRWWCHCLTIFHSFCRSASFALHRIGKIRSFLDKQTAERLVHAFVMCHIDFCNSLLQGLPAGQIKRLQTIQNSAARLVSRTKKYQSISPVLQSLHWLPVHYRIMFKILLLSYQCFHNLAPSYLTELLTIYKPGRNLRSGKKNFFVISPVLTKTYGERTFAHAAPIMWNNLPDSLRSLNSMEHFKSALKTYLFQLSLISWTCTVPPPNLFFSYSA